MRSSFVYAGVVGCQGYNSNHGCCCCQDAPTSNEYEVLAERVVLAAGEIRIGPDRVISGLGDPTAGRNGQGAIVDHLFGRTPTTPFQNYLRHQPSPEAAIVAVRDDAPREFQMRSTCPQKPSSGLNEHTVCSQRRTLTRPQWCAAFAASLSQRSP